MSRPRISASHRWLQRQKRVTRVQTTPAKKSDNPGMNADEFPLRAVRTTGSERPLAELLRRTLN